MRRDSTSTASTAIRVWRNVRAPGAVRRREANDEVQERRPRPESTNHKKRTARPPSIGTTGLPPAPGQLDLNAVFRLRTFHQCHAAEPIAGNFHRRRGIDVSARRYQL